MIDEIQQRGSYTLHAWVVMPHKFICRSRHGWRSEAKSSHAQRASGLKPAAG